MSVERERVFIKYDSVETSIPSQINEDKIIL